MDTFCWDGGIPMRLWDYDGNPFVWGIREDPLIWVNFITTSRHDRALGIMVYFREIIPFYGPTIQVSE